MTTMGVHHRLAHVLGGRYGLPHAGVHSVLLPHVAAFNTTSVPEPFGCAARALGVGGPEAVAAALHELAVLLGAPTALAGLCPARDAIPAVATTIVAGGVSNPRPVGMDDLAGLLQRAHVGGKPLPDPRAEGAWYGHHPRRSASS